MNPKYIKTLIYKCSQQPESSGLVQIAAYWDEGSKGEKKVRKVRYANTRENNQKFVTK